MITIPVSIPGNPAYDVRVSAGLIANLAEHAGPLLRKATVPIVADAQVHALWGGLAEASLAAAGKRAAWRILPPGEGSKSWGELIGLADWLLGLGVERGDAIVALGGGVIGDLAGFAAAILKRGCRLIQVPTTLLAQVDSSVGGKTAINVAAGKNLIGAFHQPALVLADLDALTTLPRRELAAGYAEVVKYGVLGDADFFAWCEANGPALLSGDPAARAYAVATSVRAKAAIVAADPHETTGARALLNLGHSFGHALEAETGFGARLLHGEAVALGMVLAARFSTVRGLLAADEAARIAAHLKAVGLPTELGALGLATSGAALAEHMRHDKKMDEGRLALIVLRGIGAAFVSREASFAEIADFLEGELRG